LVTQDNCTADHMLPIGFWIDGLAGVDAHNIDVTLEAADKIGAFGSLKEACLPGNSSIVVDVPPAKTKMARPMGCVICPSWKVPSSMGDRK